MLCVDPGETTGWALFEDAQLAETGQTALWEFLDELWEGVLHGARRQHDFSALDRIVVEDFVLYPWAAKALSWDKLRTPRGIGGIEIVLRHSPVELEFQPAKIKESAVAAGAEELFLSPRHENRHANDAIMHGVYWLARNGREGTEG